jgi:hypothetical protein
MATLRMVYLRACVLALASSLSHTVPAAAQAFDFHNGKAPDEVVIPRALPAIYTSVSPGGNDATLVLRVTTLIANAWFDAIAPYHPTAVGVYSRLGRRPATEALTNQYKNIAIIHASYRVLNSLLPQHAAQWREMLTSVGLDPDDAQVNSVTPVGIGNAAGAAVVAARERDGMNQLGDEGGRTYDPQPYADYTGYAPVNTPDRLKDPSRWQPLVVSSGTGVFRVQQFATPQLRLTRPYSLVNPNSFHSPVPKASNPRGPLGIQAYRVQADEVLAASANLTDYQKMAAELFDDKLVSLGFSALFMGHSRGLALDELVHYDFLTNMAAFDAAIVLWKEKTRHDAVRPVSAIRHLYGNRPVTAWGGPGKGTVTDLPASQWRSYLGTADHPEYPSGSTGLCVAHAQASRRYFGSNDLGWSVSVAAGSSRVEPGITPRTDMVLGPWGTWDDFEEECGLSRHWGGVHFLPAIAAARDLVRNVGDIAYEFLQAHLSGAAQ